MNNQDNLHMLTYKLLGLLTQVEKLAKELRVEFREHVDVQDMPDGDDAFNPDALPDMIDGWRTGLKVEPTSALGCIRIYCPGEGCTCSTTVNIEVLNGNLKVWCYECNTDIYAKKMGQGVDTVYLWKPSEGGEPVKEQGDWRSGTYCESCRYTITDGCEQDEKPKPGEDCEQFSDPADMAD